MFDKNSETKKRLACAKENDTSDIPLIILSSICELRILGGKPNLDSELKPVRKQKTDGNGRLCGWVYVHMRAWMCAQNVKLNTFAVGCYSTIK